MTPWEIAYHFPGKYKEYVTREFPDDKMPSAGQAAQEGASPPRLENQRRSQFQRTKMNGKSRSMMPIIKNNEEILYHYVNYRYPLLAFARREVAASGFTENCFLAEG